MSHRTTANIIAALAANPGSTRADIARAAGMACKESRSYLDNVEARLRALHRAGMAYVTGWRWRGKKNTAPADWVPCWALQPRPGWYCDAEKPQGKSA